MAVPRAMHEIFSKIYEIPRAMRQFLSSQLDSTAPGTFGDTVSSTKFSTKI